MTGRLRFPCSHGRYDPHEGLALALAGSDGCPGGEFLAEDALVIKKVDGEWPEGVEVWWFCKTEGQRRKKYLGCFGPLNCRPDSGCGLRLFVPIDGEA